MKTIVTSENVNRLSIARACLQGGIKDPCGMISSHTHCSLSVLPVVSTHGVSYTVCSCDLDSIMLSSMPELQVLSGNEMSCLEKLANRITAEQMAKRRKTVKTVAAATPVVPAQCDSRVVAEYMRDD